MIAFGDARGPGYGRSRGCEIHEEILVGRIIRKRDRAAHLDYITGAGGSRGPCWWSKSIAPFRPRFAVHYFSEGFAEVVTEKSVKDRVDAAVGVSENVADNLQCNRGGCERIRIDRLDHQYHL